MTAFGPYADTQTVDFDELNDAGIFLLTGPTGAGKTSILDAVCFALYGVVPGVREVKTLRSHHAAAGVAPEVVLEATIGDRRLRVRRSPEWWRPKKRGDGETRENASATLLELAADGTERLISSRVAEVGHELTMAIGMSSEQFMQVVMLPQGDFQKFLRASSDERQGVLEKLFRTQRFARIEDWMRERSKHLAGRAGQGERRVAQLLATITDRSGAEAPEPLAQERLGDVASAARTWAREVLAAADGRRADAHAAERAAERRHRDARAAHDEGLRLTAATARRRKAEQVLAALAQDAAASEARQTALARHDRAVTLRPLLTPLATLAEQMHNADQRCERAAASVSTTDLTAAGVLPSSKGDAVVPERSRESCCAAQAAVADRLASLRAALPREAELAEARRDLREGRASAADSLLEQDRTRTALEELPARRAGLLDDLTRARVSAAALDTARRAVADADSRHQAVSALRRVLEHHQRLADDLRAARDRAADAREHHLDVVERRLTGMAAELAGQLTAGSPCTVCGSHEHPRPAAAAPDAVTEADQRRAAEEHDRVRLGAERAAEEAERAAAEVQRLETAAEGRSPAEADAELAAARLALEHAERARESLAELELELADLERDEHRLRDRLRDLEVTHGAAAAREEALASRIVDLEQQVSTTVGPQGGSIAESLAVCEAVDHALEQLLAALDEHARVTSRHADATAAAHAAAADHGFTSVAAARDALLDAARAEALREIEDRRQEERRAAELVLEDEDLPAVPDDALPDLDRLASALTAATDDWQTRAAQLGAATDTCAALGSLVEQLDAALEAWEPARAQHATADAMARLVRGMGTDNQLQMRLSSYVLATRLDQVLEAANERLSHMRDQRYTLRRCGKARGGARAGLGLEVLDAWTGEARAPSTLSGGETFVVSLALALGLADVVTQESGGLRVDTLFIDEGFGMLDPDTLDDVMDRIDALRAGGRTVGVVSHVTELRGRIPTQVHVSRRRTGSAIEVRTLVA